MIQFQWMTPPFDTVEARNEVRRSLNEIEGVELGEDRLGGRPSVPLGVLADSRKVARFLAVFAEVVARTRAAAR